MKEYPKMKKIDINQIINELKKIHEIPVKLSKLISSVISYQNKIIQELNSIVLKYEGQEADLETLEESLQEFKTQHTIAKKLQSSIFPTALPDNDIIKITAKLNPMSETSGDFYDIAEIVPKSVYGILVSDIQGHGVSAALVTNLAKVLFVTASDKYIAPKEVLKYINNEICKVLHFRSFFTAFYIVLDFPNRQMLYSAGGHNYSLRYNAKTKELETLETKNTIIGVVEEQEFEEKIIEFNAGDRIFIYTDGISEAMNEDTRKMFGDEKVKKLFMENATNPASKLIDILDAKVKEFTKKSHYDDDVTMIVIDIVSEKERAEKTSVATQKDRFSKNEVSRLINYYQKSIKIKEKQNDKIGLIKNLKSLGSKLVDQQKWDDANECFTRAEKVIKDNPSLEIENDALGYLYSDIANYNYHQSHMEKAIEYGHKALELFKKEKNEDKLNREGLSTTYNIISVAYSKKGESHKSREYLRRAIEELQKSKESDSTNSMKTLAMLYNNLGFAYGRESQLNKSLKYFLKSEDLAERSDYIVLQATLMNNIGDIYRQKTNYKNALKYFHKGLRILDEIDNKNLLGIILFNISIVYFKKNDRHLMFYYLKKAIDISKKYHLIFIESALKSVRAYHNIKQNNIFDAIPDITDSIKLIQEMKFDPYQGMVKIAIAKLALKKPLNKILNKDSYQIIKEYTNNELSVKELFESAIKDSSKPMNIDVHALALDEYAIYLYNKGKKNEAEETLMKAFKEAIKHGNVCERDEVLEIVSRLKLDRSKFSIYLD